MATLTKRADETKSRLLELLTPGATVYTILRWVSESGMSRRIDLYVIHDNRPVWITGYVADLLGHTLTDNGMRVSGCGMDMGFHTVYNLSRRLFDTFTCLGEHCPSNDHCNGDRDYTPHQHSDTGYALHHSWL
jgi:hypothetical protein